jgi:nucleoside diphosphate kinase
MQVGKALAEERYTVRQTVLWRFGAYIPSAPVMAIVWEGPNAVAAIRRRWAPHALGSAGAVTTTP